MAPVLSRFRAFARRYPVIRGMITYSAIWPTSCFIQQTMQGKNYKTYDYMRALRFSLFGSLFVAPTLFCWIRLSTHLFPQNNLRSGITKAFVEQLTYGPAALCCFLCGMSLLEGNGLRDSIDQIHDKFFPAYKVALCYWPFLQTINFCYISERNRVPFVSVCSLVWTCFLAYMQITKKEELYDASEVEEENISVVNIESQKMIQ